MIVLNIALRFLLDGSLVVKKKIILETKQSIIKTGVKNEF